MRDSLTAPPLSVVIVSKGRWPAIRRSLDALHPQAVAVGAEVIAAIGDPAVAPPDAERQYPAVIWVNGERGASVFQLRALALAHCCAPIIAFTEDHAWIGPDWCTGILEAHARYPNADAIGGVVENGATTSLKDWAGFFVANGRFMRPIRHGPSHDISLQANVSYRRRALPQSLPEFGLVQSIFHRQLRERGAMLIAVDGLVVYHAQELSLRGHSAACFHNARTTAAHYVALKPQGFRILSCLVLPIILLGGTVWTVVRKRRHLRELMLALPFIVWLVGCHCVGEVVGRLAGAGSSAQQVK